MQQDLEMAHKELLSTERRLNRAEDDVQRARLVEDGLLNSNSEIQEYVPRYTASVIAYTTLPDR